MLQLLQIFIGILNHFALIKGYGHGFCKIIYLLYNACISIKNSCALVYTETVFGADFPFKLIVVLNLHYLVTFSKNHAPEFLLALSLVRRIKVHLQYGIKPLYPK